MSNVVDLRDWRNKPVSEQPRQRFYASTQETLALLQAFTAIKSLLSYSTRRSRRRCEVVGRATLTDPDEYSLRRLLSGQDRFGLGQIIASG